MHKNKVQRKWRINEIMKKDNIDTTLGQSGKVLYAKRPSEEQEAERHREKDTQKHSETLRKQE